MKLRKAEKEKEKEQKASEGMRWILNPYLNTEPEISENPFPKPIQFPNPSTRTNYLFPLELLPPIHTTSHPPLLSFPPKRILTWDYPPAAYRRDGDGCFPLGKSTPGGGERMDTRGGLSVG